MALEDRLYPLVYAPDKCFHFILVSGDLEMKLEADANGALCVNGNRLCNLRLVANRVEFIISLWDNALNGHVLKGGQTSPLEIRDIPAGQRSLPK